MGKIVTIFNLTLFAKGVFYPQTQILLCQRSFGLNFLMAVWTEFIPVVKNLKTLEI